MSEDNIGAAALPHYGRLSDSLIVIDRGVPCSVL
jgi:hypothetical protein